MIWWIFPPLPCLIKMRLMTPRLASRLLALSSASTLFLFFITVPIDFSMLQPATSLLHCSMHHLPFCVPLNSSSSHWDGHHDSSRLCLSARMNKRCRGKAEQLYRFSLTCGEPCCQMSISLYFYLFLKKTSNLLEIIKTWSSYVSYSGRTAFKDRCKILRGTGPLDGEQ